MFVLSSKKGKVRKYPIKGKRKANLRAQTHLPTSIRTNFSERSFTLKFIFPGGALTLIFTCNSNSNGHQSTDRQVYNERQSNKQNVTVGNSKTAMTFLYFFKY